jgi:hypothetical protein
MRLDKNEGMVTLLDLNPHAQPKPTSPDLPVMADCRSVLSVFVSLQSSCKIESWTQDPEQRGVADPRTL